MRKSALIRIRKWASPIVIEAWRQRSDAWFPRLFFLGLTLALGFNLWRWPSDLRHARRLRAGAGDTPLDLAAQPRVSVLVAAWNERNLIARHIASVKGLAYSNLEHVLCAGGTDGTYECAGESKWPGLVLLRQVPGEGQQQAAARCLAAATGEIALLTDADCELTDASFTRLLAPIINQGESASTGSFRPLPEQFGSRLAVHRWVATTYRFLQGGRYIDTLNGPNAALKIDVLRESEADKESVWIGMDVHIAARVRARGYRIRFEPLSEVPSWFEEKYWPYARQRSRWLGGILIHALARRDWYQVFVVSVFYAVGAAFVGLPLLSPILGRAALAAWAAGVVCAMMNRVRYLAFTAARLDMRFKGSMYTATPSIVLGDLFGLACAPWIALYSLKTRAW